MKTVLETTRLVMGEMAASDLDFVAEMLADPEVMRFYPKVYSRQEALGWIENQLQRYARDGHGLWLVRDKSAGHPVGQVGLVEQQVGGRPETEVGYLIHRLYWRRGLAREAALAARDFAFGALDRSRVVSLIRPENIPSRAVAEGLGMTVEGKSPHGGFHHLVYSVSRDGLEGVKVGEENPGGGPP